MSDRALLTLGLFVFAMDSLPFQELQRRTDWRHASSERFGARPASQYAGPGEDKVSLTGTLVPEVAGAYSAIERLREMADSGDSWPLVTGQGTVLGNFRIVAVDERQTLHLAGGLPRRVEFAVDLERVS